MTRRRSELELKCDIKNDNPFNFSSIDDDDVDMTKMTNTTTMETFSRFSRSEKLFMMNAICEVNQFCMERLFKRIPLKKLRLVFRLTLFRFVSIRVDVDCVVKFVKFVNGIPLVGFSLND